MAGLILQDKDRLERTSSSLKHLESQRKGDRTGLYPRASYLWSVHRARWCPRRGSRAVCPPCHSCWTGKGLSPHSSVLPREQRGCLAPQALGWAQRLHTQQSLLARLGAKGKGSSAGRAKQRLGKSGPGITWLLTGWEGGAFQGLLNTQEDVGLHCKLKQLWDELWRVLFHYELGNKVFGKKANSFLGEIPLHKLQNRSPIKGTAQIDSLFHSTYHCWSTTDGNQHWWKSTSWRGTNTDHMNTLGHVWNSESKASSVHPVWAAHLLI